MSSPSPITTTTTPAARRPWVRFSLALTVAVLAALAALWTGKDYWIGDGRIARSADLQFVDLTYAPWHARIGPSDLCPDYSCLTQRAAEPRKFGSSLSWPAALPMLADLGDAGLLFLSRTMTLPEGLRPEPQIDLGFDALEVRADAWEFFVNGELVESGEGMRRAPLRIPARLIDGPELTLAFKIHGTHSFSPGFAGHAQPFVSRWEQVDTIRNRYRDSDNMVIVTLVIAYLALALLLAAGSFFTPFHQDILALAGAALIEGVRLQVVNGGFGSELSGSIWGWTLSAGMTLLQACLMAQFFCYTLRLPQRVTRGVTVVSVVALLTFATTLLLRGPSAGVVTFMIPAMRGVLMALMAAGAALAFRTALTLHVAKLPRFRRNVCLSTALLASVGVVGIGTTFLPGLTALQGTRVVTFAMLYWKLVFLFGSAISLALEWARAIADRQKILSRFGLVVDRRILREVILRRDLPALRHEHTVVLAADMRNFTAHCETYEPAALLYALNQYLDVITTAVHRHGGAIDKFMGDGVLALWGIPSAGPNDELAAVRAALAIREGLARLNVTRAARGDFPIEAGIGIHAGRVIFGPIGNAERVDFTVIGPAVNIAARLESLTKKLGVDILISPAVMERAGSEIEGVLCGRETLRGSAAEMAIYKVAA